MIAMAATAWDLQNIDIRTRSVEKVLVPLIAQVGILVKHGKAHDTQEDVSHPVKSLLPNLELSIFKFTSIGHEMGSGNAIIRDDMYQSCDTTNKACNTIVSLLNTDENNNNNNNNNVDPNDRTLPEAAKALLSAITRILILADRTAIMKLVKSAGKVHDRLQELENVTNFTEFVNAFSQFGGDMVELAYISGERQNDLRDDLQRAEVCAARAILEKSTMMLLTTCKTCLRHPDSPIAKSVRSAVFQGMRDAMSILKAVIENNECPGKQSCVGISLDLIKAKNEIEACSNSSRDYCQLEHALDTVDSINIDMEDVINKEHIEESRKSLLKALVLQSKEYHKKLLEFIADDQIQGDDNEIHTALDSITQVFQDIILELNKASSEKVMDLIENTEYKVVLAELKKAALLGELSSVEEVAEQLENVLQNILEVTKLAKNTCNIDACIITAMRLEENLIKILPQAIDAGKMLAAHPTSKITQENFEVFIDVWDTQIDELISLLRNITEEHHGADENGEENENEG